MQAIHNKEARNKINLLLFQRAKIQDKCKQFTTYLENWSKKMGCFKEQRYKINASNSQRGRTMGHGQSCCFKEQRYKINASNSQLTKCRRRVRSCCFKEQRYKINASNSQQSQGFGLSLISCFKEQKYKFLKANFQSSRNSRIFAQ